MRWQKIARLAIAVFVVGFAREHHPARHKNRRVVVLRRERHHHGG